MGVNVRSQVTIFQCIGAPLHGGSNPRPARYMSETFWNIFTNKRHFFDNLFLWWHFLFMAEKVIFLLWGWFIVITDSDDVELLHRLFANLHVYMGDKCTSNNNVTIITKPPKNAEERKALGNRSLLSRIIIWTKFSMNKLGWKHQRWTTYPHQIHLIRKWLCSQNAFVSVYSWHWRSDENSQPE